MKDTHAVGSKSKSRRSRPAVYLLSVATVLIGLSTLAMGFRFTHLSIPDIGLASPEGISTLKSSWADGEVITLIRHEERCSRSTAVCLDELDGITVRGKDVATAAGKIFEELGLQDTNIFTSNTTRTKQTAMYMFKSSVVESERLANCKSMMFRDISKYKSKGRNLILVTHSGCIEKILNEMKDQARIKPNYGSLVFILLDKEGKMPSAAEYVEAKQLMNILML